MKSHMGKSDMGKSDKGKSDKGKSDMEKAEKLFQALSAVDEELLSRSEITLRPRWTSWRIITPVAACLCMAVTGILLWRTEVGVNPPAGGAADMYSGEKTEPGMQEDGASNDVAGNAEMDKGMDKGEPEEFSEKDDQILPDSEAAFEAVPEDQSDGAALMGEQDKNSGLDMTEVLPQLVFVNRKQNDIAETSRNIGREETLSEEDMAGIWGVESLAELSFEGYSPYEYYSLSGEAIFGQDDLLQEVKFTGTGMAGTDCAFEINLVAEHSFYETEPTCRIYGVDVAAYQEEIIKDAAINEEGVAKEKHSIIYVYEAEFLKEGNEGVFIRIRTQGSGEQGREMARELITCTVSSILRNEVKTDIWSLD